MRHVLLYSLLLVVGLGTSQILPSWLGDLFPSASLAINLLTMFCLAYIMIHVGFEFQLQKNRVKEYGWDYLVAMIAATLPWILTAIYFVWAFYPDFSWLSWKEALLGARFASPTSAGVLFSMLAAAGLAHTWMYQKARLLAIFDDLDTVLLMLPLQMLFVGFRLELVLISLAMIIQVWLAWKFFHALKIPSSWPWVVGYSLLIALASKAIYLLTKHSGHLVALHIEVLLPAFVLGCMIKRSQYGEGALEEIKPHEPRKLIKEQHVSAGISASFMFLVGLSMPAITMAGGGTINWGIMFFHVLAITLISNVGKLFPALCYRKEASWRERLAVAIGMFPRGEVGAGVLIVSLAYGVSSEALLAALLSMALNLILTGAFIWIVKALLQKDATKKWGLHYEDKVPI